MTQAVHTSKLVFLSSVPWHSFAQRSHFLIREFLDRVPGRVLWVDPYPGRLPRLDDFRRIRDTVRLQSEDDHGPSLRVVQPRALPVEPISGLSTLNHLLWTPLLKEIDRFVAGDRWILGIGRPSALAVRLLTLLQPDTSFYDAMDDFPEFYWGLSRRASIRREQQIVDHVQQIYVSSSYLEMKFKSTRRTVTLLPNACDTAALPNPVLHRGGPPIFGYVGTIGDWFDWDIVLILAEDWPDAEIRLIGPVYGKPPPNLPDNVQLQGPCTQDAVGDHLSKFSVGLIPFKLNSLTRAVDPIKYYEYRSMGLPVLTTRFGEMIRHESDSGVFIFDVSDRGRRSISAALSFEDSQPAVLGFRKQHSWSQRFTESGLMLAEA